MALDPNNFTCPDYSSAEHATSRPELISDMVDDAAAAMLLSKVWRVNNNAAKLAWQCLIEDTARRATEELRCRVEVEADRAATLEKTQMEAEEEALKKNWAKHVVIPDRPPPLHPSIIPSTYVCSAQITKGRIFRAALFHQ